MTPLPVSSGVLGRTITTMTFLSFAASVSLATTANAAAGMRSIHSKADKPFKDQIPPIYTGRHLWSDIRPTTSNMLPSPLVAYEELPLPNSDRAELPSCTVRWRFTGRFSLNREEDIARGSIRLQVRRFLASNNSVNTSCMVNFPRGVGRGRVVEVTVSPENLDTVAAVQLVFNGSQLQRLFVGPDLPRTSLVIEVLGIPLPLRTAWFETAANIASLLQPHVRVHDIWVAQKSYANDPTPPEDTNNMVALASLSPGEDGGVDPYSFHSLPDYLNVGGAECKLVYARRLS
ncbi:uncharacterized protein PSANT_03577 [Moesziomyces antarcticus]|uniref:Uncharacterized protein n=1 Tax=Pseudozyma antarctica TaxID=84753 RepID=A0A5C3FQX0_PSEA2|nr:uncharacterized protein PSANT_03577 [Moesziomyces antarcticus]